MCALAHYLINYSRFNDRVTMITPTSGHTSVFKVEDNKGYIQA